MAGFRPLHLRWLAEHRLRSFFTGTSVAVATALATALVVVVTSMLSSVDRVADFAGHSDVEIAALGGQGFDEGLLAEVTALPGVSVAAPVVRLPAVINGRSAVLFGINLRLAAIDSGLARAIDKRLGADADPNVLFSGIALGPGLESAPGTTVALVAGDKATTVNVLDVVQDEDLSGINDGRYAVGLLAYTQQLTGRAHRLDAIYIQAAPGVDPAELRQRVASFVGPSAAVSSPSLFADQSRRIVSGVAQMMTFAIGLVLLVAGLLVFDTMSMAALERRTELATLRALGGRRGSVLFSFELEAAVLGATGAVVGAAVGVVIARGVVSLFPPIRTTLVDIGVVAHVPVAAVPAAVGLFVVVSLIAGLPAARRATRVQPAQAMRSVGALETSVPAISRSPAVAVVGLLAVGLGVYLTAFVGAANLPPGVITTVVLGGAAVASFAGMGTITRVAAAIAQRLGPSGRLAAASSERSPRRTWATVMAVGLAAVLVVAVDGIAADVDSTIGRMYAAYDDAELLVQTTNERGAAADLVLPAAVGSSLRQIDGVAAVSPVQYLFVTDGGDRVGLIGLSPGASDPLLELADPEARSAVITGSAAIVTRSFADPRRLHAGSMYDLATPSGLQTVKVAAVVDLFTTVGNGAVAVSYDQATEWTGRAGASRYQLTLTAGASLTDVRQAVSRAVSDSPIPAFVLTGHDLRRALDESIGTIVLLARAVEAIAVLAALLATANTTMIAVLERHRELGVLRAVGASARQLRRMIFAETAVSSLLGAALGCALGVVLHRAGVETLSGLVGFDVRFRPDPIAILIAGLVCVIVTIGSAVLPARRAARLRVAAVVGSE